MWQVERWRRLEGKENDTNRHSPCCVSMPSVPNPDLAQGGLVDFRRRYLGNLNVCLYLVMP